MEHAEPRDDLADLVLGPDIPSKMVLILLPACAVAFVAVTAATVSWLVGPALAVGAAIAWYGWQAGARTRVELTREMVRVQLPIRRIEAGWGQVSAVSLKGGLQLTLADGSRFTTSLHGRVIGADFYARHLRLGRRRLETSLSLERSLRAHVQSF